MSDVAGRDNRVDLLSLSGQDHIAIQFLLIRSRRSGIASLAQSSAARSIVAESIG